jgi:hypothetical protein
VLHTFSTNTLTYCFLQNKKIFVLIVSRCKGWGLILCREPYFLIKKKNSFFFSVNLKSYDSYLSIIFLGFQRGYFQYLKLKGMGYKFINRINNIILKFGFSHRVIYINSIDTKCSFINRSLLGFETRSL